MLESLIKSDCGNENISTLRAPQSALPAPWRSLLRFSVLDSTQLEAGRRVAAGEGMAGVVLWAERQSAGRGRLDHDWVSEAGGLYVTAGLPYDLPFGLPDTGWIALLAALAAAETIQACLGVGAQIKWPNDLIVAGAKIGGLLGEVRAMPDGRLILIGMGINWMNNVECGVRNAEFNSIPPGSLVESRPHLTLDSRGDFLAGWLTRLNHWREQLAKDYNSTVEMLRREIQSILWKKNEAVCLRHTERGPVRGRLLGLGSGGAARLETAPGQVSEYHCGWQA